VRSAPLSPRQARLAERRPPCRACRRRGGGAVVDTRKEADRDVRWRERPAVSPCRLSRGGARRQGPAGRRRLARACAVCRCGWRKRGVPAVPAPRPPPRHVAHRHCHSHDPTVHLYARTHPPSILLYSTPYRLTHTQSAGPCLWQPV
jgi:hypothetical protein